MKARLISTLGAVSLLGGCAAATSGLSQASPYLTPISPTAVKYGNAYLQRSNNSITNRSTPMETLRATTEATDPQCLWTEEKLVFTAEVLQTQMMEAALSCGDGCV